MLEENNVLLKEIDSKYIGRVTPSNRKAEMLTAIFAKFLNKNGFKTSEFLTVGSDRTTLNSGLNGGVIALLEQHKGRLLLCII